MKIIQALPKHIIPVMAMIKAITDDMAIHNMDQWDENYPTQSILEQDIQEHHLYLLTFQESIRAQIVLNEHQDEEYKAVHWQYPAVKVLVIHRLCVHPAWRGQGYACQLMAFAEQYARENHYDSIRLDAYTANPAATSLYEKRGYHKSGQVWFPRRQYPFNCYEKNYSY